MAAITKGCGVDLHINQIQVQSATNMGMFLFFQSRKLHYWYLATQKCTVILFRELMPSSGNVSYNVRWDANVV